MPARGAGFRDQQVRSCTSTTSSRPKSPHSRGGSVRRSRLYTELEYWDGRIPPCSVDSNRAATGQLAGTPWVAGMRSSVHSLNVWSHTATSLLSGPHVGAGQLKPERRTSGQRAHHRFDCVGSIIQHNGKYSSSINVATCKYSVVPTAAVADTGSISHGTFPYKLPGQDKRPATGPLQRTTCH